MISGSSPRERQIRRCVLGIACAVVLLTGCGSPHSQPAAAKRNTPGAATAAAAVAVSTSPPAEQRQGSPRGETRLDGPTTADEPAPDAAADRPPPRRRPPGFGPAQMPTGPRTFADLIASEPQSAETPAAVAAPLAREHGELLIDDTKAAVGGIRKLVGKHLALYTDVLPHPEVDDLTDAFDAAVPQWCRYFGIPSEQGAAWKITAFLMQDRDRFAAAGMYPDDLPPFPHGFQRGGYFWVYEQADAYYRRHLLLHEGTHAFMAHFFDSLGPPWYAEGMAELLGTHRWQDGQLTLAYLPRDKSETPGWGRIKIIKDEAAAHRGLMPQAIMEFGPTAHREVQPYGWCWGLATFLDTHPRSQEAFRQLRDKVRDPHLTSWFQQQLLDAWPDLNEEWQLFVMNLDYGYEVGREVIERKTADSLPPEGGTATIAADRGWQSSGFRLEGGEGYRVEASGRYQLGQSSDIWWCEPGGITLHYHQGRPLGLLLGAIRDDSRPLAGLTPLARPAVIGLGTTLDVPSPGTLYLRINESAAGLGDNAGQLQVRITRLQETAKPSPDEG